jgi:aspartate/methionine/tyrosine aminotransferase
MEIAPFEIERFYERWEFAAELMLSSSDCESRTLEQLLALEPDAAARLNGLHLGYTEVPGSAELRASIAGLHERCGAEDVLSVAAAEEGIFLAYHGLVGPGDHVIVESPCYGSAIELARSTGAAVSLWERRFEDGWEHDLDELERLLRANTKLIYINSPHNPTGTQMARATFERVIDLARERGAALFSDEV